MSRTHTALAAATLAALGLAAPQAAHAQTTLTFSGLNLAEYGTIPADYGSAASATPNVAVSYATRDPATGQALSNHLDYWDTNYGDLVDVAFASQQSAEAVVTLTPGPGHTVTLTSFDMAGWCQTNKTPTIFQIVGTAGKVLVNCVPTTILGAGGTHSNYTPRITSSGPLSIVFGNDYNIGIDNIRFAQDAAAPEPSQTAALGVGLLGLAGLMLRARRRKADAA